MIEIRMSTLAVVWFACALISGAWTIWETTLENRAGMVRPAAAIPVRAITILLGPVGLLLFIGIAVGAGNAARMHDEGTLDGAIRRLRHAKHAPPDR